MIPPIVFRWSGEAMEPLGRFHNVANASFVVGQVYTLEERQERSKASHDQQFAYIHDLWLTLPESVAPQFPTETHLRKHALIMTGWAKISKKAFSTHRDALAAATLLTDSPHDDYELVTVEGNVVTRARAKSQSMRAMGKEAFQRSKSDVIAWIEDLIGIKREAAE